MAELITVRKRAVDRDRAAAPAMVRDGAAAVALDQTRLLRLRGRRFRHASALRVRGARSALAFVEEVGFCSTFYCFREGVACLWAAVTGQAHPRWPRRSHHDAGVGLTWDLKHRLPAARQVYYGKLLKGRPLMVALDLFPAFYALVRGRQRARHYVAEYADGRLSRTARRIMDVLIKEHPLYTRDLRASTFMLDPARTREFERAMAELQQGLWVVKTEERYEPTFSYRWDLLETWLPEATAAGRRLGREAAIDRVLDRYLRGAVFTQAPLLARLFRLGHVEVEAATRRLVAAGTLASECAVRGWPGRWLVHRTLLGAL